MKQRGILNTLIGFVAGALLVGGLSPPIHDANAQSCPIDLPTLTTLYSGIFHRPLDGGAYSYVGYDVGFVIDQLLASEENGYYTKVYEAAKNIEDAQRQNAVNSIPGYYSSLRWVILSRGHQMGMCLRRPSGVTQEPQRSNRSKKTVLCGRTESSRKSMLSWMR